MWWMIDDWRWYIFGLFDVIFFMILLSSSDDLGFDDISDKSTCFSLLYGIYMAIVPSAFL